VEVYVSARAWPSSLVPLLGRLITPQETLELYSEKCFLRNEKRRVVEERLIGGGDSVEGSDIARVGGEVEVEVEKAET
jgi:hypothetical protein